MFAKSFLFSSFSVKDLDEAKKFYTETLGLTATSGEMGTLMLHGASGSQVMVYPKEDHQPATFTVLNLMTDDIDEAVDELIKKGVNMEQYGEGFF
jgi:catechol 2,3-dioxygenase-like lactoylglutathione lyase family enzyme